MTAILIGLDVLKKERGPFESLRDFEMVVAQLFIVTEVFRPDPRRFEKLHGIHQFSVEAEIARILEVAVLLFFSRPRSVTIVVDVFKIIRTLPEANIVDNELEVASHRLSDRLKGLKFTVDVLIDDDLFHPHLFHTEEPFSPY